MPGRHARGWWIFTAFTALLAASLVVSLGGSAAASGAYDWTPYDLTSLTGGYQSSGQPSLITDPQGGDQEAVVDSPSAITTQFGGDGTGTVNAYPISGSGYANGPASSGSPSAIKDPQSGDFDIFTDTTNGDLEQYDRSQPSFVWDPYNITSMAGGQTIVGNPSATVVAATGQVAVAADSSNGDLVVFNRAANGTWSSTDVTSSTGVSIAGDPTAISDPQAGNLDIVTVTPSDHYVQFAYINGTWDAFDMTANNGGQTINGDPTVIADGQDVYVFASSSGGDLIEWYRGASANGNWVSTNLTTLAGGGPTISNDAPTAVVDPDGGIDVFAAASNEHLIEYDGSGTSWSATDLTSSAGGPTIAAPPAAAVSASTGNLVVYATSPASHLIELERTAAPAPSSTSGATVTQTVVSTPYPTPTTKKSVARKEVRVTILMDWIWYPKVSQLHWIKLGKLTTGEGLTLACKGTGKKKTTGCPYKKRSAKGKAAVAKLIKKTAKSRYRPGVVLTVTVSKPKLKSEVAKVTVRSNRRPTLKVSY